MFREDRLSICPKAGSEAYAFWRALLSLEWKMA